ncbi:uncharacterized protein LOC110876178 [Helianthus annuus]|uniref:uncharacterized protein LOC110876178 n=1 Tax=Helianthus annuus TaxID=4232 RepID=UPI000B8F6F74|nr:uncharacterized protein LOC110876178 [Helianthus annuus]
MIEEVKTVAKLAVEEDQKAEEEQKKNEKVKIVSDDGADNEKIQEMKQTKTAEHAEVSITEVNSDSKILNSIEQCKKCMETCRAYQSSLFFGCPPQGNGQVEQINRRIVDGIKRRLGYEGKGWADELPNVMWAHRTLHKTSNGETPFSLTYGTEAVIPAETGLPNQRYKAWEENECELQSNLDLLEERRNIAAIKEARYKKKIEKYYNARAKLYKFKVGDYVLRSNDASRVEVPGKLTPKWEGPYRVKEASEKGSYVLEKIDGTPVPRTWNGVHLKKCFM